MPARTPRIRPVLLVFHRWIGVLLLILLVPVAVSGALLVWKDGFDALLHPHRYAVSAQDTTLPPSAYLASAAAVLENGVAPTVIRYPESAGWPVIVSARGAASQGQPSKIFSIYLDPATATVLDVVDFRRSLFGFLHVFHENLTIPQLSGRAIVGWAGVGMLILSLSGIWLWWPRNGAWHRALRFRRTADGWNNLHQMLGFLISIPLALVSFTGIYLSFPPQARALMATVAPTTQIVRGGTQAVRTPGLTADKALDTALDAEAGSRPVTLFMPVARRGEAGYWRVATRHGDAEPTTLMIDDTSGAVTRQAASLAGDRASQWIRWIHDGGRGGIVWQILVFLTGVFPAIFAATGVVMWLRGRRRRKAPNMPALRPAE